jgi:hypothetical protein
MFHSIGVWREGIFISSTIVLTRKALIAEVARGMRRGDHLIIVRYEE